MIIRRLDSTHLTALQDFLLKHINTSMSMSLNLFNAGIEGSGEFSGKYVGAFDDSERLAGVLVLYWNGILMSQCSEKSLLLQLVADFKKEPFSFQGIFGTTEQVALIKQELPVPVDEIAMDSVEQVFSMSLDSLAIPTAYDGMEMVKVGDVNQSLIAEWLLAYSKEALGLDHYDVDRIYSSPECFVLKVSGQPVSLCNFNARLPEVVQVGPVWTPPQYRGCK